MHLIVSHFSISISLSPEFQHSLGPHWHLYYFPLLHNKLLQKSCGLNNIYLLSHNFPGSGVRAQLSWVLCSGSHKTVIKVLSGVAVIWGLESSPEFLSLLSKSSCRTHRTHGNFFFFFRRGPSASFNKLYLTRSGSLRIISLLMNSKSTYWGS